MASNKSIFHTICERQRKDPPPLDNLFKRIALIQATGPPKIYLKLRLPSSDDLSESLQNLSLDCNALAEQEEIAIEEENPIDKLPNSDDLFESLQNLSLNCDALAEQEEIAIEEENSIEEEITIIEEGRTHTPINDELNQPNDANDREFLYSQLARPPEPVHLSQAAQDYKQYLQRAFTAVEQTCSFLIAQGNQCFFYNVKYLVQKNFDINISMTLLFQITSLYARSYHLDTTKEIFNGKLLSSHKITPCSNIIGESRIAEFQSSLEYGFSSLWPDIQLGDHTDYLQDKHGLRTSSLGITAFLTNIQKTKLKRPSLPFPLLLGNVRKKRKVHQESQIINKDATLALNALKSKKSLILRLIKL